MKITEIFSVDEDLKGDPANCKIIATLSNGTIKTLCDVKEAAPSNPDLSSAAWCGGEPDQAGPCRVYQQARQPDNTSQPFISMKFRLEVSLPCAVTIFMAQIKLG